MPPITKKSGMICPIQVASAYQGCASRVRSRPMPPRASMMTPVMSRWITTTRSTQNTRARSSVRSRFDRSIDAPAARGMVMPSL
jgi:hypothetical protein